MYSSHYTGKAEVTESLVPFKASVSAIMRAVVLTDFDMGSADV